MGPELIVAVVAVALTCCGWALRGKLATPLQPSATLPDKPLSVIIPARNEAHNLPRLLGSLCRQDPPPAEVLVVDDGSSDDTAAVARSLGARVVPGAPPPNGWRGKPWACQQGAQLSSGELLLFVDADVWLEPGGLDRLLRLYSGGALSLVPWHEVRRLDEQLSLFFNVVMALGTVGESLTGQMLLVDRDSYWRVRGHERVKHHVLENLWLTAEFRAAGVAVTSGLGRGILRMRMYPSGGMELVRGWAKGFVRGAQRVSARTRWLVSGWIAGLTTALLGCCVYPASPVCWAAYVLCGFQLAWMARQVGRYHPVTAWLYPVPLLFFFGIMAYSGLRQRRGISWKGRTVHAG